jgi:hypothetical protein
MKMVHNVEEQEYTYTVTSHYIPQVHCILISRVGEAMKTRAMLLYGNERHDNHEDKRAF